MSASLDNSPALGEERPDLKLVSSDQFFYNVHRRRILSASDNAFGGLVTDSSTTITLGEPASVVDLLVNIIHGISCAHLVPSLETTEATLDALVKYGIPLPLNALPGQPLYQLLLQYAPQHAIDAYILAGHHGLDAAAMAISRHLVAYRTSQLSNALVIKMGPIYFRRLVCLQQDRLSALRSIVHRPPAQHPPTPTCGADAPARTNLARAWLLAAAGLVWDLPPDVSTEKMRQALEGAGKSSVCDECHATLQTRIEEACEAWAAVQAT